MRLTEYVIIQKITKCVVEKAVTDGMAEDSGGQVRPVMTYAWALWSVALLGIGIAAVCRLYDQRVIGGIMLLCCALLSVPGLLMQYNCRLTYDEGGFIWRSMLRISRRYSYEAVTGLSVSPLRVVVQLENGKQLDFDYVWRNRHCFAQAIEKYRSRKPPKLLPPVMGMTSSEIKESYENGVLGRALLVKKQDLPRFARFRWVHYGMGILSGLFAAFAIFLAPMLPQSGGFLLVVPGLLLTAAALALYFLCPQYFTAREKPAEELISKKQKSIHKCCTMPLVNSLCIPGGAMFLLEQSGRASRFWPLLPAAGMAAMLYAGLLLLFRRFSWEYRTFRVGCVSFAFSQAIFCLMMFFVLGGILI